MEVKFFDEQIERFIFNLQKKTIAKTLRTIDLLEEFGHKLGMPHSRRLGKGCFELRIRGGEEIRIFYIFDKGNAVLVHGFVKKTQKIPRREFKKFLEKLSA